jgi:hypothetical protein
MIYKFKSKATGDIIMMGPTGDALLRAIGREPASKGIIEPAAMSAAMQAIAQAVVTDEAARAEAEAEAASRGERLPARDGVGLRQRLWPMVDMLKRAEAADEPVVWGV